MKRMPGDKMMALFAGGAQDISTHFGHEDVANTLWALATLGRTPGAQVMALLERRAAELSTAAHFALQDVANTLWATCFFSIHAEQSAARFSHAIRHSLLSIDTEAIVSGMYIR
jgi:hypothetical protein